MAASGQAKMPSGLSWLTLYPEPKTLAEKLNELLESSPKVLVNSRSKLERALGDEWRLWQRLQYDAVLPPLKVMM